MGKIIELGDFVLEDTVAIFLSVHSETRLIPAQFFRCCYQLFHHVATKVKIVEGGPRSVMLILVYLRWTRRRYRQILWRQTVPLNYGDPLSLRRIWIREVCIELTVENWQNLAPGVCWLVELAGDVAVVPIGDRDVDLVGDAVMAVEAALDAAEVYKVAMRPGMERMGYQTTETTCPREDGRHPRRRNCLRRGIFVLEMLFRLALPVALHIPSCCLQTLMSLE